MLQRFFRGLLAIGLMVLGVGLASGQDFPSKPIRIITTASGGGSDITSRIIATGITGSLGQPIVVDNRAVGFVAAETVAKSPPDGYSLLVTGGSLWTLPMLRKVPYEMSELAPVSQLDWSCNMVAVHPSLPVKNIKELIALAKSKPALSYAADSVGGRAQLATELFKSMTGVDIMIVPYKGFTSAIAALIGGETHMIFADVALLVPHVKSGRLRGLAITSLVPSAMAPGMPTVAESGVPGYESIGITGMYAPAKTPAPIVNRLSQEVTRFLSRPEVKERFLSIGIEAVGSTPEQLATVIKTDMARIAKVIKDAKIKAE